MTLSLVSSPAAIWVRLYNMTSSLVSSPAAIWVRLYNMTSSFTRGDLGAPLQHD